MFDFARYGKRDHIAKHDDRAIVSFPMVDEAGETYDAPASRAVAAIYYLSREWKAQYGGALVDLEASDEPKHYVPQFNRLILFRVPRWHLVEAVKTDKAKRMSIFGWFCSPGVLYDLEADTDADTEEDDEKGGSPTRSRSSPRRARGRR